MARYNEILVGRYNRLVQKLLSMKGDASLFQFSTEMMAVLPFFNGAENRYLESWQRFALSVNSGIPAAGNRSAVRIRMNAGANVIAVIEKLQIWTGANTVSPFLFYNAVATVLPTENVATVPANQIDARGGQTGSSAILSTSINFGLVGSNPMWQAQVPANSQGVDYILTDIQELPLAPGSEYTIVAGTLVQAVQVNFMWRERFLEESERT